MSITEELREFIDSLACHKDTRDMMRRIADRIDAEHERGMADAELCAAPTEAQLSELGWVQLPVDADGVPIYVGDELTNGTDMPAKVRCMVLDESGWMVSTREIRGYGVPPATLRHVKPDSWERIMDDAKKLARGDNAAVMELVARCKRLAGERA